MNKMNIRSKWRLAVFIVVISLLLMACGDFSNGTSGRDMALVNQVEVVTAPGNPPRYIAVAAGILPDGCTTLGRASQRVTATTINVTLPTRPTEGTCSQLASVPFRERIRLRVDGLSAGSYSVDVNGTVTSFFLAEVH